ncbi:hypothetical protein [Acidianus sp. HS-5]|uniref:hypothetical protein n=1 Tax=Acidianus sp. HS-5 TaxID=2886040 RepID=UPI001F1F0DE6|nr:hypothetical protein [Acidianus sp. HS-5]
MKIKDIIYLPLSGLKESLEYGISEAEYLGKEFIGLTLSNGDGIILRVNPYSCDIKGAYLMSAKRCDDKRLIGVFKYEGGNTYFIYEITDLVGYINNKLTNERVVYVEVIKDVLEDFLLNAVAG